MEAVGNNAQPPGPAPRRLTGNALSWAALLLLVVIWGSTFAVLRVGVETITPAWLVGGRLVCGTIFLGLWLFGAGLLRPPGKADASPRLSAAAFGWFALIGIGATTAPFILYAHAAESVGSAVMSICNGGTPFATVLMAHAFTGDRLTPRRLAGVLLGFLGLVVLVLPEFATGVDASLIGILLAIVGAWLYAVGNIATRLAPHVEPVLASFVIVAFGAVSAVAYAAVMEPFPVAAGPPSLAAMMFLGMLSTAFAMFIYVWLIRRSGPVFVSFVTYLSPLWATGLGVLFLGEDLEWSMAGALALILIGVAVANRRPKSG